jgi:hypothetical protein
MDIKDYVDLFQIDAGLMKLLDLYSKTKNIYKRTKVALGQISSFQVTNSNANDIKVSNVIQTSTKIYPVK